MKKTTIYIVAFVLVLATHGYSGQEIGNGTLKILLTLDTFNAVLETLEGHYLLELEETKIPFSLSEQTFGQGKLKIQGLESSSPIATIILDQNICLIVRVEIEKKTLTLVEAYETTPFKKLNAHLYKLPTHFF